MNADTGIFSPGWRNLALVASAVGLLSSIGCANSNRNPAAANSGKLFAVTANETSFYRFGPQQGTGPDQTLTRDTLVTLIRPSFGYSKVQLVPSDTVPSPLEGYVASEDIRPAPPTLLAALTAPAADSTDSRPKRENFDLNDPSAVPPPESLPDPDLPPTIEPLPPSTGDESP